jgi:pyruvate dehydrogenase E2 component (dihydrolipoyllysine-residue acetyltransferase)
MPKFGLTMHEGTVQRFFKAVGEAVKAGEPLYEVETEKVLYEVEAPADGTLAVTLVEDGATVECGIAVAVIAEQGEDLDQVSARYQKSATRSESAAASNSKAQAVHSSNASPQEAGGARRAASPIARKLAAELGVNLDNVQGSGPGGRITREDVERASKSPPPSVSEPAASSAAPTPLRGMRKIIAERMHQSLQQSAQLTIAVEADVTPATELRARLTRDFDFSYTDLLIHAVARALMRHPRMNTRLDAGELTISATANVGVAVALEEGLIVPVVASADRKALREIAIESKSLGEKARGNHLRLEDVTGGTFTITNLGTYGVDTFTPILNPGETGILGVGRIIEKPAIYRGEITRRAMMTLSLTFDHRVIDGAPAAEFLQTVIEIFNYGER